MNRTCRGVGAAGGGRDNQPIDVHTLVFNTSVSNSVGIITTTSIYYLHATTTTTIHNTTTIPVTDTSPAIGLASDGRANLHRRGGGEQLAQYVGIDTTFLRAARAVASARDAGGGVRGGGVRGVRGGVRGGVGRHEAGETHPAGRLRVLTCKECVIIDNVLVTTHCYNRAAPLTYQYTETEDSQ